jgi:hypothetical protein
MRQSPLPAGAVAWVLPAFGLVASLGPALLGCRGADGEVGPGKPAALECSEPAHDFGKPRQGQKLRHVFSLRNPGSRDVRVFGAERSYSCRAIDPPGRVRAGTSVELAVECDNPKLSGKMADEILVRSSDPAHPELKLALLADIEPLLAFESASVSFDLAFGERREKVVKLVGHRAREARLRPSRADARAPKFELLPASNSALPAIRVEVAADRVERRVGQLYFATGLDEPREISLTYAIDVTGNLTVNPTTPYFNLREPPPRERVLLVSSKRGDFVLHAAEVSQGPFRASFTRDEARRSYAVHVRFVDERLPDGERGALGTLLLVSNDPAEPRKEVPLFALGVRTEAMRP